jgi:hypothetical protein
VSRVAGGLRWNLVERREYVHSRIVGAKKIRASWLVGSAF